MDGMVTHHQVQQLGPAVIKPASNKENNKKGVSLCVGLTVRSDVSGEGVGVARVSERPPKYTSHFPVYHNSGPHT